MSNHQSCALLVQSRTGLHRERNMNSQEQSGKRCGPRRTAIAFSSLLAVPIPFAQAALPPAPVGVRTSTEYGIEFSTIGAANNISFAGGPNDELAGRGTVADEYRIGRTEVTTLHWMQFVNTFVRSVPDPLNFASPLTWGARWSFGEWELNTSIPDAGMVPVLGITWREAAMYCNWLHNERSSAPESLLSGAYDVSTFIANQDNSLNDQRVRSPGARFWIPSLDEWLKAGHFDPNKNGDDQPGWWQSPNGSDELLRAGLPGTGETSAGLSLGNLAEVYIPLGSYGSVQSPWGLLDLSGGAAEWSEEVYFSSFFTQRGFDGTWAGSEPEVSSLDQVWGASALSPAAPSGVVGLRIASAVPTPGCVMGLLLPAMIVSFRRRRNS
jgi:hypothetical protein